MVKYIQKTKFLFPHGGLEVKVFDPLSFTLIKKKQFYFSSYVNNLPKKKEVLLIYLNMFTIIISKTYITLVNYTGLQKKIPKKKNFNIQ